MYLPTASTPPDPDFRETVQGGHALIVEHAPGHALVVQYGDCDFWFSCECGYKLPLPVRPDQSLTPSVERLLGHTSFSGYQLVPHCQCGERLGRPFLRDGLNVHLDPALERWEKHSMTVAAASV